MSTSSPAPAPAVARPSDVPASGAANPYNGAVNTAVSAACVPTMVMARKSLPNRRMRSPTHVHRPAMTPVSPASGPTLPPNSSGSKAAIERFPRWS